MGVKQRGQTGVRIVAVISATIVVCVAGCTVYPDKQPPSLAMTTSAEQVDRIFWQDVEQAKWAQANALLAPNAIWRVGGRVVPRAEIIPWLQAAGIHAVQVTGVTPQPAVNDMNLIYTLQVQADKALQPCATAAATATQPQTLSALAVWQQPQPTGDPKKDNPANGKAYAGYLLTVHDLALSADASCH